MPKNSKKPTIAIFTSGEGHTSISQAIQEALEEKYQIETFYEDIPLESFYVALYQFIPGLHHLPFKAMGNSKNMKSIHKLSKLKYQKKINQFFSKHKAKVLISTHGLYISSLEELQKITETPTINIISDPKTPHPLTISPTAKSNLVFNKDNIKYCQKYYPDAKYQQVGWFVRERFEEEYDQKKVCQELKLDPDQLTFLVASGSEGTNLILKILPGLLFSEKPIQIIVACGNNKTLYKSLKGLNSLLGKSLFGSQTKSRLIPLKFTPEIHRYMQAADLVIGKAGPNTLFESVATLTPFFAITHIAGQEDGNLEIIEDYKLGYVEENPLKAQKLLKEILEHPEGLQKFQPSLQKLRKYNQGAKKKLRGLVKKLLNHK